MKMTAVKQGYAPDGHFDPGEVARALDDCSRKALEDVQPGIDYRRASAVLFLIGNCPPETGQALAQSPQVRQAF